MTRNSAGIGRGEELAAILRAKAKGERNSVGDVWGDWICAEAANEIERLRARQPQQAKD